jgi:hypothetical protein
MPLNNLECIYSLIFCKSYERNYGNDVVVKRPIIHAAMKKQLSTVCLRNCHISRLEENLQMKVPSTKDLTSNDILTDVDNKLKVVFLFLKVQR